MNQQFDPNNPVFQQLGGFQNFQNAFNALSQQVPQNFDPKTVGQQFVQQRMASGAISNKDFERARQIANAITGMNL